MARSAAWTLARAWLRPREPEPSGGLWFRTGSHLRRVVLRFYRVSESAGGLVSDSAGLRREPGPLPGDNDAAGAGATL